MSVKLIKRGTQTRRQRSTSCGRGVRQALTERLCRPLFGGSTREGAVAANYDSMASGSLERSNVNRALCFFCPPSLFLNPLKIFGNLCEKKPLLLNHVKHPSTMPL